MKPLVIVKTGSTLPEVAARRGDFEAWIASGLALERAAVRVAPVFDWYPLPDPSSYSGVVVTGSSALVTEREDWSEQAAEWLRGVVEANVPLLGICYGHQLLAHGLGGRVADNPSGREIGTVEVELHASSEDDALLGRLPRRITVQASHTQSVIELPPEVVHLGGNDADPHHAFRVGERAWGVQFHPEFDADIMRGYINGRRPRLEAEGLDADALLRAAADSPHGWVVLARFGAIVEERA